MLAVEANLWQEKCGIIGLFGDTCAAKNLFLGLHALQHRGQEAFGMVTLRRMQQPSTGNLDAHIFECKGLGTVSDKVSHKDLITLEGDIGLGHVRYSTQGENLSQNIQPFIYRSSKFGPLTLAHNGNITNSKLLQRKMEEEGSIFTSTSDTEVMLHLLARSKNSVMMSCVSEMMGRLQGAYSAIITTAQGVFGFRDPLGFRPLVLGKLLSGAWVLCSETCALDLLNATYIRDIKPGEVIWLSAAGIESKFPIIDRNRTAMCSFEPIYFSRPDSICSQESVYQLRWKMGVQLAKEAPVDADVIVAVPDSGVPAAMGYARESGIPLELGLVRNHYVGRTFIEPAQDERDFRVKLKLNPIKNILEGRKVIVVDDSIVRGSTCRKIVAMLRDAGPKEIHLRVSSPPISNPCFYGVATPNRDKLLAAQHSLESITKILEVDSLAYLSVSGLQKSLSDTDKDKYCYACFTGHYPEPTFEEEVNVSTIP